jgi:hypothetical protein
LWSKFGRDASKSTVRVGVTPAMTLSARSDCHDVVVDRLALVRGARAGEVEPVVAGVDVRVDALVAAIVEAVTVVEVAPPDDPADEKLMRAVHVQPEVREQLVLPQDVVLVVVIVQREVADGDVGAIVDKRALPDRHVRVDLEDLIPSDLLDLSLEALQVLRLGAGDGRRAQRHRQRGQDEYRSSSICVDHSSRRHAAP